MWIILCLRIRHISKGYLNLFKLHPWLSVMESLHMLCKLQTQEKISPVWIRAKHEDLFACEALTGESVSWESLMYNSLRNGTRQTFQWLSVHYKHSPMGAHRSCSEDDVCYVWLDLFLAWVSHCQLDGANGPWVGWLTQTSAAGLNAICNLWEAAILHLHIDFRVPCEENSILSYCHRGDHHNQ